MSDALRVSWESGRPGMTQACSTIAGAMPACFLSQAFFNISPRQVFRTFTKLLKPGFNRVNLGEHSFYLPQTLELPFRKMVFSAKYNWKLTWVGI